MTTQDMLATMDPAMAEAYASIMSIYWIAYGAIMIVTIIGMWKMFGKAGKPGWAAIIPFYNNYCLFDMGWGNGWMFLLLFIPCVNVIFQAILAFKLASAFGRGVGFGFGLWLLAPIFYMILGFGEAEYIGPQ
jgi:hypothetical protein